MAQRAADRMRGPRDARDVRDVGRRRARIQWAPSSSDVSFAYPDAEGILKNVSFSIRPGERVAIVGPSGVGKTTLMNMIPRFHDPTGGRVLVDGTPTTQWPLAHLRAGVGVAFQEVFLFNCSIWADVLYGRTDSEIEEVIRACTVTGAHDFIQKLPVGYASMPSAMGGRFSRGERQRITLARAILKSPRILIMDEATSSLDPEAGATVIRSIFEALPDSSILLITHDPAIWRLADRVIELTPEGVRELSAPGRAESGAAAIRP